MLKTVKIPYKKIQNYILIKRVDYNIRARYKKVSYAYEEYKDGELIKTHTHRIGKPAVIIYRNNHINELQYWKFGKLHRSYGPAIIIYDGKDIGSEKWFHEGKRLTDLEIEDEKKLIDRRKKLITLILKIKDKIKFNI
jgi:hypothetical protein